MAGGAPEGAAVGLPVAADRAAGDADVLDALAGYRRGRQAERFGEAGP